jgi:hypothetical protein
MNTFKWQDQILPESLLNIKTMLTEPELKLLYSISKNFKNEGIIVDAGCFIGGSTLALASGILGRIHHRVIHSYDRFLAEKYTLGKYIPQNTELLSSILPLFLEQTKDIDYLVQVYAGDILTFKAPDEDIEILFLDVLKTPAVNDHVVEEFFPRLIPNLSVVIQQDYCFTKFNGWIHSTMEYFSDYFEIIDFTPSNSVVFLYKKQIPLDMLKNVFKSMSKEKALELQQKAIERFPEKQQLILRQSAEQLKTLLFQGN